MIKKLFIFNLSCMLILILTGFISGSILNPCPFIDFSLNPKLNTPIENLLIIYKTNFKLLFNIMIGSITFGIYSFLILCWNSFIFGSGVISLYKLAGSIKLSLISYISLEFLSLCLITTAAEKLGINLFLYLLKSQKPSNIKKTLRLANYAFISVTIAGILEAYYIYIS